MLSGIDGNVTGEDEVAWLNELTGLYNIADAAQLIPPASLAKLAARALKKAHDLDESAAKERRQEFHEWLDGGSTHLHNGRTKLPGRAAYRFIRSANGWTPAARGLLGVPLASLGLWVPEPLAEWSWIAGPDGGANSRAPTEAFLE